MDYNTLLGMSRDARRRLDHSTMSIVYTMDATEEDKSRRMFPASRHRSERIRKKLIKRHGAEFGRKPAIFKAGGRFYVHPAFRATIETHGLPHSP